MNRRSFLTTAGAAIAATAVPTSALGKRLQERPASGRAWSPIRTVRRFRQRR